jgi:hypothetical protein
MIIYIFFGLNILAAFLNLLAKERELGFMGED